MVIVSHMYEIICYFPVCKQCHRTVALVICQRHGYTMLDLDALLLHNNGADVKIVILIMNCGGMFAAPMLAEMYSV